MAATAECPQFESWSGLLGDTLSPGERAQYERHLETCLVCQDQLDRCDECEEAWRQLARHIGDPTETPADPRLTQVLVQARSSVVGIYDPVFSPRLGKETEPADLYFLRPSEQPDLLGMLGPYEVQEVIGQGGMGVVLKAYEPALHRLVAIKVLAAAVAGSATARRRFTREAQAAAAVCHEHIVPVHGVHETDGLPYLVMQYVAGESLQGRLDRQGPLEITEIIRIAHQTAAGLAAAHAQGLIHRDIKPANLLLENGLARVKITDFGLARMADDTPLTQPGVVAGTPEYMAPEQARGEPVDHRADLFSLGSVIYAMCTGRPPFRAASAVAVLRQVSDDEPASIQSLNPDAPEWLATLVARLMAKDPTKRPQSAAEVATLLEGYLAHLRQPATVPAPPLAKPDSVAGSIGQLSLKLSTRFSRRTRWLVAASVGLLLLGGAFLALYGPDNSPAGDAVAALEKLGGKIKRDSSAPGKPVIEVDLKGTKVTDADLQLLAPLKQLRTLELGDTAVTGAGLRYLAPLSALEQLRLERTTIKDADLAGLAAIPNLGSLSLEGTELTDDGLKALGTLDRLIALNIGSTKITDAGLKSLAGLKKLTWLALYNTGVTDAGMKHLLPLTELAELIVVNTGVTSAGLGQLSGLPKLRRPDGQAAPATPARQVFYQDFRAGQPRLPGLKMAGMEDADTAEPDERGLHIRLPATRSRTDPVGPAIFKRFGGNFEITSRYEIVGTNPPNAGSGLGVELYIMTDSEADDSLGFAAVTSVDGQRMFKCTRMCTVNGKRQYDFKNAPATGTTGRLRMERKGREAILFVAEGDSDRFREVARYDFVPADLKMVRVAAYPGQTTQPVDIRIVDLRVQADGVTSNDGSPVASTPDPGPKSRGWLVASEIAVLGIIIAALAAWRRRRRQLNRDDAATPQSESDNNEPKRKPVLPARPAVGPERFSRPMLVLLAAGALVGAIAVWLIAMRSGSKDDAPPTNATATVVAPAPQAAPFDVWSVTTSQDGKIIAAGGGMWEAPGEIGIWDATTLSPLQRFAEERGIASVALSPDGKLLASGGWDGHVRIRDWATGKVLADIEVPGVSRVAFSPAGDRLAIVTEAKTAQIWDVARRELIADFAGEKFRYHCVTFSPDGKRLLVGGGDWKKGGIAQVNVWDIETKQQLRKLVGHSEPILSVACSHDGKLIATGSNDKTIRLWDADSGAMLKVLAGHKDWVESVAFTPDDRLLLSGSHDQLVATWDMGRDLPPNANLPYPMKGLKAHPAMVRTVCMTPDGQKLIVGGAQKTLFVYDTANRNRLATLWNGITDTVNPPTAMDALPPADSTPNRSKHWLTATGIAALAILLSGAIWVVLRRSQNNASPVGSEQDRDGQAQSIPSQNGRKRLWPQILILLACLGLFGSALARFMQPASSPGPITYAFRDGAMPAEMTPFGPLANDYMKKEAEGLRITLPRKRTDFGLSGLSMPASVSGDFEITLAFDMLQADTAGPKSYGVGLLMSVNEAARVGCVARGRGIGQVVTSDHWETLGGKRKLVGKSTPTDAKVGRIRLKRTGSTLHYQWAANAEGGDFAEFDQCPFVADDINLIRLELSGDVGGDPGLLDVRLRGLTINSKMPTSAAVISSSTGRPETNRPWLTAAGGILAFLAIGLLAAWFANRGRRAGPGVSISGAVDGPTPTPIIIKCPSCGRGFKGKPEWAGKKAKCPCGGVVAIPAPAKDVDALVTTEPTVVRRRLISARWLALFAALQVVGLAAIGYAYWGPGSKPETLDNVFYHDFRGGKPLPPTISYLRAGDNAFIKSEPQGTRITLPKTFIHDWGGVGFDATTPMSGDFEITAAVELLHADVPAPGQIGVGAAMRIEKDGAADAGAPDSATAATICRVMRDKDGPMVAQDVSRRAMPGGKPTYPSSTMPCEDAIGRLRMKRIGPTLYFMWGSGTEGENFEEINHVDFGTEDIVHTRLTAMTGRQPRDVDVRLIDLRMRGGPTTVIVKPPRWLMPLALMLGIGLLFTLTTWFARPRAAAQ